MNPRSEVYVVAAHRTAIGSFHGEFSQFSAPMLGAAAIRACLDELMLIGKDITHVVLAQVASGGLGSNPAARTVGLTTMPSFTHSETINVGSASGLKAVQQAYDLIRMQTAKLVVCGGQENVTMAPQSKHVPTGGSSAGDLPLHVTMLVDGLSDGFTGTEMRERANQLAAKHNVSREAQDEYAYDSIKKAIKAMQEHHFNREIVVVHGYSQDETLIQKLSTTLDMMKNKLTLLGEAPGKPSTVTDANSANLADGAAALILCNGMQFPLFRQNPLVKIVRFAEVQPSPDYWGIGSAVSIQKLLELTGWSKESVDLFEIQEVFAVQALIVIDKLQIDPLKVNISGGAIALGHPVGASGAGMLVTLIHNLVRLNLKRGIASVCTGKDMALAVAVETLEPRRTSPVSWL